MTEEHYETLLVRRENNVAWLYINRPEAQNAINVKMVAELRDFFYGLYEDRETRLVVLAAKGRHFCAGLDIKEATSGAQRDVFGAGLGFQRYLSQVFIHMRRCPQPILALVHGAACGGGFAFALAADVRIAAESARMNAAFVRVGLSACDMGLSYHLPRLVGTSVASELMMTGRFIHAERALHTGLVSEVVPDGELESAAASYIEDMLLVSPLALRLTKEGLNMGIDAPNLEAAVAMEDRNQIMCSRTKDTAEAMFAFLEKRKPEYTGR
ncbi:enoyl-CoA hydratase-related protein [Pseudohaliea sp.]|uniref:enoyl-CoA hydratase/isomerase family protein n=1 Tax=Pseudohaliea sp. TaxID=2740289 RepID=UPI0032ECAEC2